MEERVEQGKNQVSNAQNYINIAYYLGKQYIHWDAVNKRVYEASKEDGRTQFVANRTQKVVRTELAKIVKNKPIMKVVPASNEEDDIRSAKTGDKILDYLEYKHKLNAKVDKRAILWGLTTEFGMVHPYWDVSSGKEIEDPTEPGKMVRTGEEKIDILSPFELILDPDAKYFEEVAWAIKPKVRKVKYIKDRYGKDVTAEDGIEYNNGIQAQLDSLYSKYGQEKPKRSKDTVTVYECWEAPSSEYAKGRRWAVANGVLLYSVNDIGFGENDDSERELPFFIFVHIEVPGKVGGQSIIEVLAPIQREYNRCRSQIIDNKDLMGNPTWMVQEGAVDDEEDIPNGAGGIFKYNQGFDRPQRDQPPQMGADVYKNLDQLVDEFYFISGQQEVSHGSTPAGVTSGVAISFLQEQDDTVLAPTISNWISCKQGYMSYLLKMVKYKYDYPQTLKIVGKSNEVSLVEFVGSDLSSTDVRVQEGTMFQNSTASKQNWIMTLVQSGILNAQTDRDMIIRMLELGMVDEMYDQGQVDVEQARKEQLLWEKRAFDETIVRDFYNHDIHIQEHNTFRKGDIYEDMSAEEQKAVDDHVLEHMVYKYENEMQPAPMIPLGGDPNAGNLPTVPVGAEGQTTAENEVVA